MRNTTLHIVTAVANPLRWESRTRLARTAILDWLKEPNVHITLVECAYGARGYELADLASDKVAHIPVRARTLVWSKENMLNIGIARLPQNAKYIGTFDADIHFRKPGWATEILHALQIYPVIQPWKTALDLGPNDSLIQTHISFCSLYHEDKPVVPSGPHFWTFDGGPYAYAHTGYAWAWVRDILDRIGGLFEVGGMGSADHHMALGLVGEAEKSMPAGTSADYRRDVMTWQQRAMTHANKKLGYVPGIIEHQFHGSKKARAYIGRWAMFLKHGFDPLRDLKKNSYGVIEWAGNNPELEREWDNYLRSRNEDANVIEA
ncbi:MAG TPA: hypothetical protein VL996_05485 [Methylocella sp.]|nr:hypothetical protein [Methylocella sp.]